MILQQYPFSAVIRKILAGYYNNIKEDLPTENFNRGFSALLTDSKRGMVFDLLKNSTLLFTKLNINEVINFPIDISSFKEPSGQLKPPESKDNDTLSGYDTLIKIVPNTLSEISPYNVTETAARKFIVFTKLVGLTELTLGDVYLSESDDELFITITEDHSIFTGSLRIKTW